MRSKMVFANDIELIKTTAKSYLSRGWCSIPVGGGKNGKAPRLDSWKQYQTRLPNRQEMESWDWSGGVGIVLGAVSRLVVLDIDDRSGGEQSIQGKPTPPTVCAKTPGGQHRYYAYEGDCPPSTLRLLKGVELRSNGMIVVAPPTIRKDGGKYEFLDAPDPNTAELALLPPWVYQEMQQQQRGPGLPNNWEEQLLKGVSQGERNNAATRLAGRYFQKDLSKSEVLDLLTLWNQRNRPPLPDGELGYVVNNIAAADSHKRTESSGPNAERTAEKLPDAGQHESADRGEGNRKPPKQAEKLIRIAEECCTELFTDEADNPMAQILVDNHYETWPLGKSHQRFKRWLSKEFREQHGKPPSHQAISEAELNIEAICGSGPVYTLHNRTARYNGAIYYDLGDKHWRAVEVTDGKWQLVDRPPILFRRYAHQRPQVVSLPGGKVNRILDFLNLPDEKDQLLIQVYLVSCFIPDIPHPILIFAGEQGAAKTSALTYIRGVVDPSVTSTLTPPRREEELVQQLQHNWAAFYDNITRLPDWLSDALCRAVTEAGFTKRQLYSDDRDIIYCYRRLVGISSIVNPAMRPDFLDRCMIFNLRRMADGTWREEKDLKIAFAQELPGIVGGCFDALAIAIEVKPSMSVPARTRMADFATWGQAIAIGLGYNAKEFVAAYESNITDLNTEALQGQPFALAIIGLMDKRSEDWRGTATQLLADVNQTAPAAKIDTSSEMWPKSPQWASRRLTEAKVNLREAGIEVELGRTGNERTIILTTMTAAQS